MTNQSKLYDLKKPIPPLSYIGNTLKYEIKNKVIFYIQENLSSNNGNVPNEDVVTGIAYVYEGSVYTEILFDISYDYKIMDWQPLPGKSYKNSWKNTNIHKPAFSEWYRIKLPWTWKTDNLYLHEDERYWIGNDADVRNVLKTDFDDNGDFLDYTRVLTDKEKAKAKWAFKIIGRNEWLVENYEIVEFMNLSDDNGNFCEIKLRTY